MSARGFVPWMAMLTFYCLTIALLGAYFMVRCGTVTETRFGHRTPAAPDPVAATAADWPRGDTR